MTIQDTQQDDRLEHRSGPGPRAGASRRPFRWFTPLLGVILLGYMFFGRPFAYLSIPGVPFYPGEVVLAVGLIEAVRVRSLVRPMIRASLPLKILLAFVALYGLTLARSVPTYGLQAFRDAAVGYYGIYAFLVALAATADPTFTSRLLRWFRKAIPWFLIWAPIAVVLSKGPPLGLVPGTVTVLNAFGPGDIAIFAAMVIAFLWLRVYPVRPSLRSRRLDSVYIPVAFVALLVAGSQNRGGFFGALLLLMIVLACMSRGLRGSSVVSIVASLALVLGISALFDLRVPLEGREVSVQQVVTNVQSVLQPEESSASDRGSLQDTVEWRRQYWRAVYRDAVSPSYALNGRGFGPVLSYEYGLEDPAATGGQPTRSAHNTHLTVLARTGVPGLALWVLLWVIWLSHVARQVQKGHRKGHRSGGSPTALPAWLLGAVAAFLVGAYFDPTLDGPKGAIWLYTMVGLGAVYPYTALRRRRSGYHARQAPPT